MKISLNLTPEEEQFIREKYKSDRTHAVNTNKEINIVSRDNAICMYDIAKELLELWELWKDGDEDDNS